jgi:hypothetical protein
MVLVCNNAFNAAETLLEHVECINNSTRWSSQLNGFTICK